MFTFDPDTRYPLTTEHPADYDIADLLAADRPHAGPCAVLVIARTDTGRTADGQATTADAYLAHRADDGRGYLRQLARYATTQHPPAPRIDADTPVTVTPTPEGSAEQHAGRIAAILALPLVWADTACTGQLVPTYTLADDRPAGMDVAHDAAHIGRPCPVHHRHDCHRTDDDGRALAPLTVTCGACGAAWCERCDPAPAALCHACNGRGYSLSPIPAWQADQLAATPPRRPYR
jgi:hypothetical protein